MSWRFTLALCFFHFAPQAISDGLHMSIVKTYLSVTNSEYRCIQIKAPTEHLVAVCFCFQLLRLKTVGRVKETVMLTADTFFKLGLWRQE